MGQPRYGAGQFGVHPGYPVPASAAASNGTVYVADSGNHRIQIFDGSGTFLGSWESEGPGEGQFDLPRGVAMAPDATVYVADTGNRRIQAFCVAP